MPRVTLTVTARDLTGPQLARMRQNFNRLGQDMDRVMTNRTRQNFTRLQQSVRTTRRDLDALRGAIPDDEFFRLDTAIRRAQHRMQSGFRRTNLNTVQRDLDEVRQGFRDLDRDGDIRIRVDTSALRRADALLRRGLTSRTGGGVRVPVTPHVDPHRFRRRITSALTSPVRTAGRILGGTLSDGLGQGVANGFKGIGPVMGAALAIAIVAALAVVGAALSGLLVTALGAAFVGIGVASAFQSEEVKKNWNATAESIKKDFKSVGDSLIPVVQHAIDRLGRMSDAAAPVLKTALAETKTATDKFIQSILDGFESFGKASFQPIMDAWNVFAPVFGEEWNEFMDELGNSFGRMADLVREHPTEIAMALDIVFEALDLLIDSITFLGKAWVFMAQTAGDAVGVILEGVRYLVVGVNDFFYGMIVAAENAFGWVPGLGGQLKDARKSFATYKDGVAADLENLANSAYSWDDALNKANRKRTLEADISKWNDQITAAKKKLESVPKSKQAKLKGEISDLQAKVATAKAQLASIRNKFVTVDVTTYYHEVQAQTHGRTSSQMGRKMGGVIGSAATGGVRNNMTLVGEQGPELVDLAPGSHVRSNPDTRRLLGGGGGGGQPIVVQVTLDGKILAEKMIDPLRGEIAGRGGSVQKVLGRN